MRGAECPPSVGGNKIQYIKHSTKHNIVVNGETELIPAHVVCKGAAHRRIHNHIPERGLDKVVLSADSPCGAILQTHTSVARHPIQ